MGSLIHGIDLVHVPRVQRIWDEHGPRFLVRVFTQAEQDYCLAQRAAAVALAGRFGVKEAVLKALGTGWRGGLEWTDIETLPDALGRPTVQLRGRAAELASRLGATEFSASISHAGDYAIASVLALRGGLA